MLYSRSFLAPKSNIGTLALGGHFVQVLSVFHDVEFLKVALQLNNIILKRLASKSSDTTRVIERLTQARLSRFHTTGAASVQQASNLETVDRGDKYYFCG